MTQAAQVDVCLILEGTYPYNAGGVSKWTHDLLLAQRECSFHLVCLVAPHADLTPRYDLPSNVAAITNIPVGTLPDGAERIHGSKRLFANLEAPLRKLQSKGGLCELSTLLELLAPCKAQLGQTVLLNSADAWELLLAMYRAGYEDCSFLDYFWTWRAVLGSLYSVLLAPMPQARVYHPVCTGYAGLFAARARIETGRPVLLTEHGIYTNERRIEISMADWLHSKPVEGLRLEKQTRDLKDLWVDAFASYSRACYQAASKIVTLYRGNQQLQLAEGADPGRVEIIPNGVDYQELSKAPAPRTVHAPTVALIGRVVPIKDIKTYIRAIAILRDIVPDVRAFVLGPTNEDADYFGRCELLVNHLGIQDSLTFAGHVSVSEYFGEIDVLVLTSISEAQPLVILEAGCAGVPAVATDVGACREMIYGDQRETLPLGAGGEIVPLSNPTATAHAIARLFADRSYRENAATVMRRRVELYYNKPALDDAYREMYRHWAAVEPAPLPRQEAA